MNMVSSIDKQVREFEDEVLKTTRLIYDLMEERDTIDILEWMLDVLFFRNSHIFETVSFLLTNSHSVGAELLLRPLFEGTVILEWCLVDPKERAQRLQKTAIEGALELTEDGFLSWAPETVDALRDAKTCWQESRTKGLPSFRQMVESLDTYRKGYAYSLYKYLSKNVHGVCVEWDDFLDCRNDHAKVCPVRKPHPARVQTCRAISSFLQSRNITLITSFDGSLQHGNSKRLERIWERLYVLLYEKEHGRAGPTGH